METIKITSHDGWNAIDFRFFNKSIDIQESLWAEIRILGSFWDRRMIAEQGRFEGPTEDFRLSLIQVPVELNALRHVFEHDFDTAIEIALSSGDPKVAIVVGVSDDFVCGAQQVVFRMRYKTHRMSAEVAFVVSRSDLYNFQREIEHLCQL